MHSALHTSNAEPIAAKGLLVAGVLESALPATPQSLEELFHALQSTVSQTNGPTSQSNSTEILIATKDICERLKPLAISAYQRVLCEADVRALLAFYNTPTGTLYVGKLLPASRAASMALAHHFDENMHKVVRATGRTSTALLRTSELWAPSNPKERAAGELATHLFKDHFDARMNELDAHLYTRLRSHLPELMARTARALSKHYGALLKREYSFGAAKAIVVQDLLFALSSSEIRTLLKSESTSERKRLRAKLILADHMLQTTLEHWMGVNLAPALRDLVVRAA